MRTVRGTVEIDLFGDPVPAGRLPLLSHATDTRPGGPCHAVVLGRIHYRDDLAAMLGPARPASPAADADWALAAYRHRGISGIEALEGEFAVAVVDMAERRIVASRDPNGGYPIYWTGTADGGLALATGIRPLVDGAGAGRIDIEFLGETLMLGYAEIDYHPHTAFSGVGRLVPGTILVAQTDGQGPAIRRFWDWTERIVDPGTEDVGTVAARYADLLRAAVDERLRGTVAAHVSGGMDSTGVAWLAAKTLAPRGQPVHGISIAYESTYGLTQERSYLEDALRHPGIVAHRIAGDDLLDFDRFATPPALDEPCNGLFRAGVDEALADAAAAAGADTVLTGLGADELVSDAPFYIADLIRGGRLFAAMAEAARWARATSTSSWKYLRPFGLAPLVPAALRPGFGALVRGGYAGGTKQGPWTIPPWVERDFARRARLQRRAWEQIRQNFRAAGSVVLSEALARLRHTAGDWTRNALGAPRGLHVAHPFRDPRLIGFALGVRTRIRPEPGKQKIVLGTALRGLLPASILDRRGKAHFNAVYFTGLSRNLPYLETLVRDSPLDTLGLFDKDRLLAELRRAALGTGDMDGVIGLNNSLAILRWLAALPEWVARSPEPFRTLRPATEKPETGGDMTQRA